VTVVVLLILVLIGGWIVLGQQGIVPAPSRTLGFADGLTETSAPGAMADNTGDEASTGDEATGESPDASSAGTTTSSPETSNASPSATESDTKDANNTADGGASATSQGFDRSAGGFTIAVASRESESQARALVDQFRRNLSDTNLRIDVVVGESGGTTRYRVGVGQFATRAEANNVRNDLQSRLPNGAWPVPIE
jgi:hypothetical protein